MSLEIFTKINFRAKVVELIDEANAILDDYAAQGFTLTLRQLFYQFVARQVIPNSVEEYARIGRTMVDARCAGLVDWERIEDRTRELETYPSWGSPADIIYDAARSYRENPWLGQSSRPEVWIEKSALIGVIEPACRRWRVPHMAARGYPSHSELYAAGKRSEACLAKGLAPVILYLGDHDPSGLDMGRNLREALSLYARHPIEVTRLGLNFDQVRELHLPPNPAKQTDKRYGEYVRATGQTDSWELDALTPSFVGGLVDDAIRELINEDAWQVAIEGEEANRDLLDRAARSFARTGDAP